MKRVIRLRRLLGQLRQPQLYLLVAFLLLASATGAWAMAVCIDQYNASGCLMASGCDYYDDATGDFRGSVRVHYHCPISY